MLNIKSRRYVIDISLGGVAIGGLVDLANMDESRSC
jgi:hypothetical protein